MAFSPSYLPSRPDLRGRGGGGSEEKGRSHEQVLFDSISMAVYDEQYVTLDTT